MKKERFIFADVIRTIAIIFVIMIHTTSSYMYDVVLGTDVLSFNLVLILNSIFSIAVALFFMILGAFLYFIVSYLVILILKKIPIIKYFVE